MGLFSRFPYTNFHELNLDWILRKIKALEKRLESARGIPEGGTDGQVLAKDGSENFKVRWQNPGGAGAFLPLAGGAMNEGAKISIPGGELDVSKSGNKEIQLTIGEDGIPYILLKNGESAVTLSMFDALLQIASVGAAIRFESAPQCAVEPATDAELANKKYVDSHSGGGGTGNYLPLAGGTLTGAVYMEPDGEEVPVPVLAIYRGSDIQLFEGTRENSGAAKGRVGAGAFSFQHTSQFADEHGILFSDGQLILDDRRDGVYRRISAETNVDAYQVLELMLSAQNPSNAKARILIDMSELPAMTGYIAPTDDAQFVQKKYVDDAIAAALGG